MRQFIILLILTWGISATSIAQRLSVEELLALNKKTELQLSGILQRNGWKYHHTYNYFSEGKQQAVFSKQASEDPVSLEFLKYNYVHLLHDSYLELVIIDSLRHQELLQEVMNSFSVQKTSILISDDSVTVYANDQYSFLFKEKYSEKLKLQTYHFYIYNTPTYITLKRRQDYQDFWSE